MVLGVKSYEIIGEQIDGAKANVTVKYKNEQSWPPDLKINNTEAVQLCKISGVWKIEKYIEYPRASTAVLCNQFNKCKRKN